MRSASAGRQRTDIFPNIQSITFYDILLNKILYISTFIYIYDSKESVYGHDHC